MESRVQHVRERRQRQGQLDLERHAVEQSPVTQVLLMLARRPPDWVQHLHRGNGNGEAPNTKTSTSTSGKKVSSLVTTRHGSCQRPASAGLGGRSAASLKNLNALDILAGGSAEPHATACADPFTGLARPGSAPGAGRARGASIISAQTATGAILMAAAATGNLRAGALHTEPITANSSNRTLAGAFSPLAVRPTDSSAGSPNTGAGGVDTDSVNALVQSISHRSRSGSLLVSATASLPRGAPAPLLDANSNGKAAGPDGQKLFTQAAAAALASTGPIAASGSVADSGGSAMAALVHLRSEWRRHYSDKTTTDNDDDVNTSRSDVGEGAGGEEDESNRRRDIPDASQQPHRHHSSGGQRMRQRAPLHPRSQTSFGLAGRATAVAAGDRPRSPATVGFDDIEGSRRGVKMGGGGGGKGGNGKRNGTKQSSQGGGPGVGGSGAQDGMSTPASTSGLRSPLSVSSSNNTPRPHCNRGGGDYRPNTNDDNDDGVFDALSDMSSADSQRSPPSGDGSSMPRGRSSSKGSSAIDGPSHRGPKRGQARRSTQEGGADRDMYSDDDDHDNANTEHFPYFSADEKADPTRHGFSASSSVSSSQGSRSVSGGGRSSASSVSSRPSLGGGRRPTVTGPSSRVKGSSSTSRHGENGLNDDRRSRSGRHASDVGGKQKQQQCRSSDDGGTDGDEEADSRPSEPGSSSTLALSISQHGQHHKNKAICNRHDRNFPYCTDEADRLACSIASTRDNDDEDDGVDSLQTSGRRSDRTGRRRHGDGGREGQREGGSPRDLSHISAIPPLEGDDASPFAGGAGPRRRTKRGGNTDNGDYDDSQQSLNDTQRSGTDLRTASASGSPYATDQRVAVMMDAPERAKALADRKKKAAAASAAAARAQSANNKRKACNPAFDPRTADAIAMGQQLLAVQAERRQNLRAEKSLFASIGSQPVSRQMHASSTVNVSAPTAVSTEAGPSGGGGLGPRAWRRASSTLATLAANANHKQVRSNLRAHLNRHIMGVNPFQEAPVDLVDDPTRWLRDWQQRANDRDRVAREALYSTGSLADKSRLPKRGGRGGPSTRQQALMDAHASPLEDGHIPHSPSRGPASGDEGGESPQRLGAKGMGPATTTSAQQNGSVAAGSRVRTSGAGASSVPEPDNDDLIVPDTVIWENNIPMGWLYYDRKDGGILKRKVETKAVQHAFLETARYENDVVAVLYMIGRSTIPLLNNEDMLADKTAHLAYLSNEARPEDSIHHNGRRLSQVPPSFAERVVAATPRPSMLMGTPTVSGTSAHTTSTIALSRGSVTGTSTAMVVASRATSLTVAGDHDDSNPDEDDATTLADSEAPVDSLRIVRDLRFLRRAQKEAEEDRDRGMIHCRFITAAELPSFLFAVGNGHGEKGTCILQRLLYSFDVAHLDMYQAVWTPTLTQVERRQNRHNLFDERLPLFQRCVTFEGSGSAHHAVAAQLTARMERAVKRQCDAIAAHFHATNPRHVMTRMVCHFRLTGAIHGGIPHPVRSRTRHAMVFLFCSSARVLPREKHHFSRLQARYRVCLDLDAPIVVDQEELDNARARMLAEGVSRENHEGFITDPSTNVTRSVIKANIDGDTDPAAPGTRSLKHSPFRQHHDRTGAPVGPNANPPISPFMGSPSRRRSVMRAATLLITEGDELDAAAASPTLSGGTRRGSALLDGFQPLERMHEDSRLSAERQLRDTFFGAGPNGSDDGEALGGEDLEAVLIGSPTGQQEGPSVDLGASLALSASLSLQGPLEGSRRGGNTSAKGGPRKRTLNAAMQYIVAMEDKIRNFSSPHGAVDTHTISSHPRRSLSGRHNSLTPRREASSSRSPRRRPGSSSPLHSPRKALSPRLGGTSPRAGGRSSSAQQQSAAAMESSVQSRHQLELQRSNQLRAASRVIDTCLQSTSPVACRESYLAAVSPKTLTEGERMELLYLHVRNGSTYQKVARDVSPWRGSGGAGDSTLLVAGSPRTAVPSDSLYWRIHNAQRVFVDADRQLVAALIEASREALMTIVYDARQHFDAVAAALLSHPPTDDQLSDPATLVDDFAFAFFLSPSIETVFNGGLRASHSSGFRRTGLVPNRERSPMSAQWRGNKKDGNDGSRSDESAKSSSNLAILPPLMAPVEALFLYYLLNQKTFISERKVASPRTPSLSLDASASSGKHPEELEFLVSSGDPGGDGSHVALAVSEGTIQHAIGQSFPPAVVDDGIADEAHTPPPTSRGHHHPSTTPRPLDASAFQSSSASCGSPSAAGTSNGALQSPHSKVTMVENRRQLRLALRALAQNAAEKAARKVFPRGHDSKSSTDKQHRNRHHHPRHRHGSSRTSSTSPPRSTGDTFGDNDTVTASALELRDLKAQLPMLRALTMLETAHRRHGSSKTVAGMDATEVSDLHKLVWMLNHELSTEVPPPSHKGASDNAPPLRSIPVAEEIYRRFMDQRRRSPFEPLPSGGGTHSVMPVQPLRFSPAAGPSPDGQKTDQAAIVVVLGPMTLLQSLNIMASTAAADQAHSVSVADLRAACRRAPQLLLHMVDGFLSDLETTLLPPH